MLSSVSLAAAPAEAALFGLFPHRFDYIYAPHSQPHSSPDWQTERRHPLTDRLLQQGSYLYGVRFGAKTQYCLLDIDAGSAYHPHRDPLAISRILTALEPLGLVRYLACTSSYSGGLHLYLPFAPAQSSWQIGAALTALLENAGFWVKPGQLEVFPNRRSYSIQGHPNLFNAHRLPLQQGSYLLNASFEPVWADRTRFVQQWQLVQSNNQVSEKSLRQILKQSQRQHYQVSGRAGKFLNDLNAEIELGWTGSGQTNYLLGRITLRTYVFHHILTGEPPLTGQALVAEVVKIAQQLPGYRDWCQHQHELEQRATDWASCIENSRYFHYGYSKENAIHNSERKSTDLENGLDQPLTWNQQQCQTARERIQTAIADLLNQGALPSGTTARFKALTAYGIGGSSLYRHKDLWHPELIEIETDLELNQETDQKHNRTYTGTIDEFDQFDLIDPSSGRSNLSNTTLSNTTLSNTIANLLQPSNNLTSLFAVVGRNAFTVLCSSRYQFVDLAQTGRNPLPVPDSVDLGVDLGLGLNSELGLELSLDQKPDQDLDQDLDQYLAQRILKPP